MPKAQISESNCQGQSDKNQKDLCRAATSRLFIVFQQIVETA
jgi:hypothetical protein